MLIFFKLNLINLMLKLFIHDAQAPCAATQQRPSLKINKPLPKSSFFKNRSFFLVFSRKISTNITTNNLDDANKVKILYPQDSDPAFNQ
jgi:hypothetical protein